MLVLFNLVAPAGWRVGLVRVEDVAIGAGVSLLAGALIWPRGATAVLREAFGAAYARASAYLGVTIDTPLDGAGGTVGEAGGTALAGATGGADDGRAAAGVVLERSAGTGGLPSGLAIAWAHRHLLALAELEPALAQACEKVSGRT